MIEDKIEQKTSGLPIETGTIPTCKFSGLIRLPDAETREDEALIQIVKNRQHERSIKVSLDDL